MTKYERIKQEVFAGNAPTDELAVFGSFVTGNPIYTDSLQALQSPSFKLGWQTALAANEAPFVEEMNGVIYGITRQLAYLFQQGLPEYDSETEYYKTSLVKSGEQIYKSLTDKNTGNPLTNNEFWELYEPWADKDLSNITAAARQVIRSNGLQVSYDKANSRLVLSYSEGGNV